MHAPNATAAAHIKHVALAQQLFAALFAKHGAAVDFRRHLKRNAAREICFNGAGDDIDVAGPGGLREDLCARA